MASEKQLKFINSICDKAGIDEDELAAILDEYNVEEASQLDTGKASKLIDELRAIAYERTDDDFYAPKDDSRTPVKTKTKSNW